MKNTAPQTADQNTVIPDFPLVHNSTVSFLDNASTTQKPQAVLDAMQLFYRTTNANVHRGLYDLSEQATTAYEASRDTVQQFIGAEHREEIIFTSGTTASINLVANSLGELLLTPGDVVLVSPMEHHSNIIPWQLVAKRQGATVEYFDLTDDLRIDTANLEEKLSSNGATGKGSVKIVAMQHISNAVGSIQPVTEVVAAARKKDIPVVLDAAQSVPHMPVNVQELDVDFLAFSGHKLVGPTGTGVLYGKKQWLEQMEPWQGGGDMISEVNLDGATWAELPNKFEAGTPNIAGVIGLAAAISYLQSIGMVAVQERVDSLYTYLIDQLNAAPYITVLGPAANKSTRIHSSSIASFIVEGMHPHDVAEIINDHHVAVRAGHHCAQPLMKHLCVPATTRASVYLYNTTSDIDRLLGALEKAYSIFK